jgi:hypothetical protein
MLREFVAEFLEFGRPPVPRATSTCLRSSVTKFTTLDRNGSLPGYAFAPERTMFVRGEVRPS